MTSSTLWLRRQKTVDREETANRIGNEDRSSNNGQNGTVHKRNSVKCYVPRSSSLTILLQNKNMRAAYNLVIVFSIFIFFKLIMEDLDQDRPVFLFRIMGQAFPNLHFAILGWIVLVALTCLLYACLLLWMRVRGSLSGNERGVNILDHFFSWIPVAYYAGSIYFSSWVVLQFGLKLGSGLVLLTEQIRLFMKVYSFLKTNVAKVISGSSYNALPSFRYFLFYLFVPALLYRDAYPRTARIRWSLVLSRLLEIISTIIFIALILENLLFPVIEEHAAQECSIKTLVMSVLKLHLGCTLLLGAGFFVLLHATQNLFAELTTFADRLFYEDWWTSTSYPEFLRTWNVVVHDWLYEHIYKRLCASTNSKVMSRFGVILVSALAHEWIYTGVTGNFLPVTFVIYSTFGMALTGFEGPKTFLFNLLFLFSWSLGATINLSLYFLEYRAREGAVVENETWLTFLAPRILCLP